MRANLTRTNGMYSTILSYQPTRSSFELISDMRSCLICRLFQFPFSFGYLIHLDIPILQRECYD